MFGKTLTSGDVLEYLIGIGAYDVAKAFVDFEKSQNESKRVQGSTLVGDKKL